MARLTEEQKAANKVALKERTQAFNARRKQYQAELAAAAAKAGQSPEAAASNAANAESEAVHAARNDALQAIDDEIARLKVKREETARHHSELMDAARAKRSDAWDALKGVEKALEDAVNARYPDMDGCWYVSQWKRPGGV